MNELTLSQARGLVVQALAEIDKESDEDFGGFVILDENSIERPWGWMFFYDSRKHHETGEGEFAIFGNAPYLVNRHDGSLHVAGTALAPEEYIAEYERQLAAGANRPSPHAR